MRPARSPIEPPGHAVGVSITAARRQTSQGGFAQLAISPGSFSHDVG